MAFDYLLMFDTAAVVTTSTSAPTALDVGKTSAQGEHVMVVVTAVSSTATSPTLDLTVQESTATNAGFTTVVTFDQITGTGRWQRVVQSKKRYLRLAKTLGGTAPIFTITAGIISGPQRDHTA